MFANGIECTSTTGGTAALTLTPVSNRPAPDDVWGTSGIRRISYAIEEEANGKFEWGLGTLTLSTLSLARTKIKATFDGGAYDAIAPAAVSFGSSGVTVWIAPQADDFMATVPFSVTASPGDNTGLWSAHGLLSGGTTLTLDTEFYTPYKWVGQGDITQAAIWVTGGNTASQNVKVAIYEVGDDGFPGRKLYDIGTFSLASTGLVASTSSPMPFNLPPGWYYIGMITSHSTPQLRAIGTTILETPAGTSSSAFPTTRFSKAGSYASGLPDPASTGLTASATGSAPQLFLKPRNT